MKYIAFLSVLLVSVPLLAKEIVLVSFYDPYDGARTNNSEAVARNLKALLGNGDFEISLCGLSTVFDKAYGELETCIRSLPRVPKMVLGLGETGCKLKLETIAQNRDQTFGPDNAGVERFSTPIIPGARSYLGFTYPIARMYCGADPGYRKKIIVSNFAGSFVCNNTAYQLAHFYPDIPSGFIHVPSSSCRGTSELTTEASVQLSRMLKEGMRNFSASPFPTSKSDLRLLRMRTASDECENAFLRFARPVE